MDFVTQQRRQDLKYTSRFGSKAIDELASPHRLFKMLISLTYFHPQKLTRVDRMAGSRRFQGTSRRGPDWTATNCLPTPWQFTRHFVTGRGLRQTRRGSRQSTFLDRGRPSQAPGGRGFQPSRHYATSTSGEVTCQITLNFELPTQWFMFHTRYIF